MDSQKNTQPQAPKIDYTKYPEGLNAILELLDFIPEDRRMGTMLSLIDNLGRR